MHPTLSEATRLEPLANLPSVHRDVLSAVIGEFGFGVVLVDINGNLIAANPPAIDLLPDSVGVGRLVRFASEQDSRQWSRAITDSATGTPAILALSLACGQVTVTIACCRDRPLDGLHVAMFQRTRRIGASYLAFISDQYGFTCMESRIVEHLANGLVPKQIATIHSVALSTVRTQIKHILGKAQTNSVNQLMQAIAVQPMSRHDYQMDQ